MDMEQAIKSIVAHFYNVWPVTVYETEIKGEMTIPSLYFPVPESLDTPHSKDGYRNLYTMYIKVFEKTTNEAVRKADELSNTVRKQKNKIVLNNKDGSASGQVLTVQSLEVSGIGDGVAQISLLWNADIKFD